MFYLKTGPHTIVTKLSYKIKYIASHPPLSLTFVTHTFDATLCRPLGALVTIIPTVVDTIARELGLDTSMIVTLEC